MALVILAAMYTVDMLESLRKARDAVRNYDEMPMTQLQQESERLQARLLSFKRRLGWTLKWGYVLIYGLAMLFGTQVIMLMRNSESSKANTFFEQSMAICRPYIDEHRAQLIRSRYAQVKTRGDYVALVEELRAVSGSSGQHLPDYRPW
jgi:hypothetical protein